MGGGGRDLGVMGGRKSMGGTGVERMGKRGSCTCMFQGGENREK